MEKYSDQEIIEALLQRNNKIVAYVYDKFFPLIDYMVCNNNGTTDDAEDVFQEGLVVLISKIEKGLDLHCKFGTFFYAICQRIYLAQLEKRNVAERHVHSIRYEDETDYEQDHDNEVLQQILEKHYNKLGEQCRTILKLFWSGKSYAEIGKILGLSKDYVKKRKCMCQSELIERIERHQLIKK